MKMQDVETQKKEIVNFFLKKGFLISHDFLLKLENEEFFSEVKEAISSKNPEELVVLSKEAKEILSLGSDLNWPEFEKAEAISEKKGIKNIMSPSITIQNLQKEVSLQRAEWVRMSEAQILEEFLPVYSNFRKAFSQPVSATAAPGKLDGWAKGIEYIMKQFGDVLRAHGVEEIKTVGETLDTTRHEAVGEDLPSEARPGRAKEGEIIREVETGYTMKGKVVRVAKVVVAK